MSDWSEADKEERQGALLRARQQQLTPEVISANFAKLISRGPQNIVKVTNPGDIRPTVAGYVTVIQAIAGLTPLELAELLGLRSGDLLHGAHIYRLLELPAKADIEPRGYTTLPDGAELPTGRKTDEHGYRSGQGAWQVLLKRPVRAEFLGLLPTGLPFSLQAIGKPANLSGAAWWHANEAKYPNSDRLDALLPVFEASVSRFLSALRAGGARVRISATRRHQVRAHLMLYSFLLARGEIHATRIPPIEGCDINWNHGDERTSQQAAEEMRALFGVVYKPSLTSLHISGQAIDMTINWSSKLLIDDARGRRHEIAGPGAGDSNRQLHEVGASFGVHKLLRDPPHWSVNGR